LFQQKSASARANRSHDHGPLAGFLRINRSVLAITATAFTFAAIGIHDLPAQAATQQLQVAQSQAQSMKVSTSASSGVIVTRDGFTVTSYTTVQWPINPSSPVSSPFGHRVAPCAGCSTFHRGVDFTPGEGTPIAAIADGVVTEVGNPSGELGVYVIIQHNIDGQIVSSVYGHMGYGSMHLSVGQTVTRGTIVGTVGDTGESTGPHLHFGILDAAGTPISPLSWMGAHVNQAWQPAS